jgi:hypothetical protein
LVKITLPELAEIRLEKVKLGMYCMPAEYNIAKLVALGIEFQIDPETGQITIEENNNNSELACGYCGYPLGQCVCEEIKKDKQKKFIDRQ